MESNNNFVMLHVYRVLEKIAHRTMWKAFIRQ